MVLSGVLDHIGNWAGEREVVDVCGMSCPVILSEG